MFDLYFVGSPCSIIDDYFLSKNCKKLHSFADKPHSKIKLYQDKDVKLFIDSGAFSISRNVERVQNLTIDDYIDFINQYNRPNLYANFDVIPFPNLTTETANLSAKKSYENYKYILERIEQKDKLVPVYHYGESFEYLDKILRGDLNIQPKYIAFGGRFGVHTKKLYNNLNALFNFLQKYPDVKVHAFGVTVFNILQEFPFSSADSSSYVQVALNGGIFSEYLNKVVKISNKTQKDKIHFHNLSCDVKKLIIDEVEFFGYKIQDLQEDLNTRTKFNIDYFLRWESNYKYKKCIKLNRKSLF